MHRTEQRFAGGRADDVVRSTRRFVTVALFLFGAVVVVGAPVTAGAAPAAPLDEARESFQGADFEMALRVLDDYLAKGAAGADRIEALTLEAQCHARLGAEDAAVHDLCEVLKLSPDWEPDPNRFSPQEMRTYRLALASCPPKRSPKPQALSPNSAPPGAPAAPEGGHWYKRRVVWLGVGAAALTAVLLHGGNDSAPSTPGGGGVPTFPDPPTSPAFAWRW